MESQVMNLEESSTLIVQQQQHEQKNKNEQNIDKIRAWADLPSELLELVFSGLYDPDHIITFSSIRDQIRFRLTCKNWESGVPCLLGQEFPFLMGLEPRNGCSASTFFSPITNKEIQVLDDYNDMVFPELESRIHCSRFGWLLMSRDFSLFFYNPFISGTTFKLPLTGIPHYIEHISSMSFTAPPTSSDCVVYVHDIYDPSKLIRRGRVGIYRWCYGEDHWTYYRVDCQLPFGKASGNPILYRSAFYQLNRCGRLGISDPKKGNEQHIWKDLPRPKPLRRKNVYNSPPLDIRTRKRKRKGKQQSKPPPDIRTDHYMAECDGKLVMVCVDYQDLFLVRSVDVFELDWYRMEWVTVQSLGNKAMFICETESLLIKTNGGGVENKIYFPSFVITTEDGGVHYPRGFGGDDGRAPKKVGVYYCLQNHEYNYPPIYWDSLKNGTWIHTKFRL